MLRVDISVNFSSNVVSRCVSVNLLILCPLKPPKYKSGGFKSGDLGGHGSLKRMRSSKWLVMRTIHLPFSTNVKHRNYIKPQENYRKSVGEYRSLCYLFVNFSVYWWEAWVKRQVKLWEGEGYFFQHLPFKMAILILPEFSIVLVQFSVFNVRWNGKFSWTTLNCDGLCGRVLNC